MNRIISISCFLMLIGRAYQHFFSDSPIRGLLYSPFIMKPFLALINTPFDFYINHPLLDERITLSLKLIGILLFFLSWCFLWIGIFPENVKRVVVYTSCFILMLVSFAYYKDKSFSIGQFLEYAAQMFLPLYFIIKERWLSIFLKSCIAITFFSHGLYAIGYYPIPGNFMQMIIVALKCNNETAFAILHVAGVLDFAFAIGIFIPKLTKVFLYYGLFWGFVTTFARLYTNFHIEFGLANFFYWAMEFLVRIPHFTIPIVLLIGLRKSKKITCPQSTSKFPHH